jgi:hypothetical protein
VADDPGRDRLSCARAVAWAREAAVALDLEPREAHVLLLLASHANEAGECWPGQRLLAAEAGRSTGVTGLALKELRDRGLIERLRRGPGRTAITRLLITDPSEFKTAYQSATNVSAIKTPHLSAISPDDRPVGDQDSRPLGSKTADPSATERPGNDHGNVQSKEDGDGDSSPSRRAGARGGAGEEASEHRHNDVCLIFRDVARDQTTAVERGQLADEYIAAHPEVRADDDRERAATWLRQRLTKEVAA